MQKYCVSILDDNEQDAKMTRDLVSEHYNQHVTIEIYHCAETFLFTCNTPDIALIDIELGEKSGIEVVKRFKERCPQCQIIFLTGHLVYAPDVYCVPHVAFVTKSRVKELLPTALKRAEICRQEFLDVTLRVQQKGSVVFVLQREIDYIERVCRTSYIYTSKSMVSTSAPLNELKAHLQKDRYERCHESFLVNLGKIEALQRTELLLTNGSRIPVSRTYLSAIRDALGRYISQTLL